MKHLVVMIVLGVAVATHTIGAERKAVAGPTKRDALTMSLSANLAPEPGQVSVRMRVEPDARSRQLSVEWWTQDGVGGSHIITLEGDRAATRHEYPIKQIEEGEYIVTAVLLRDDGSEVKRTARLMVVGENGRIMATGVGRAGLAVASSPAP